MRSQTLISVSFNWSIFISNIANAREKSMTAENELDKIQILLISQDLIVSWMIQSFRFYFETSRHSITIDSWLEGMFISLRKIETIVGWGP